ncbi:hypothetical protein BHM03_00048178 [Ensete ventricosum]|nr:hypothetical protein BHM03_00048178 [Ensete ventricosum]
MGPSVGPDQGTDRRPFFCVLLLDRDREAEFCSFSVKLASEAVKCRSFPFTFIVKHCFWRRAIIKRVFRGVRAEKSNDRPTGLEIRVSFGRASEEFDRPSRAPVWVGNGDLKMTVPSCLLCF